MQGRSTFAASDGGFILHDERCDAFHIYWDPAKQSFDYWRL